MKVRLSARKKEKSGLRDQERERRRDRRKRNLGMCDDKGNMSTGKGCCVMIRGAGT